MEEAQELYWWLAHQLLIFSSTTSSGGTETVIDLPWPSNQPGGAGPGEGALEEAKRTAQQRQWIPAQFSYE